MTHALPTRVLAEAIGTALLLATVVGSGIMAETLAGGNVAVALLGNTLATGAMLVVLILIFGPVSGAHFNPAVTLVMAALGRVPWSHALLYLVVQFVFAIAGVWLTHTMFDLSLIQVSDKVRAGTGQLLSEGVATFGLIMTILGCQAQQPSATPYAVGLYITGAYWFTASTSFANPAVTLARSMTDSFSGIAPGFVAGFVTAQLVGALLGLLVGALIWRHRDQNL